MEISKRFDHLAAKIATAAGRPLPFAVALSLVLAWVCSGPFFSFSEAWQIVINTGTTIVTFLMVFLIQNAQNRDTEAVQIKLDELIRATDKARNEMMRLEELSVDEMAEVKQDVTGPEREEH